MQRGFITIVALVFLFWLDCKGHGIAPDSCCWEDGKLPALICQLTKPKGGNGIDLYDKLGIEKIDSLTPFLFMIVEFHRNYESGGARSIATPFHAAKKIYENYYSMRDKGFKEKKAVKVKYKERVYSSTQEEYNLFTKSNCFFWIRNVADERLYTGPDRDGDVVPDKIDICPDKYNKEQKDSDGDGIGDACEDDFMDADFDGIPNKDDKCPTTTSNNNKDSDDDGIGDACDDDVDGDGIINLGDNCPTVPNPNQEDSDGDNVGDACDNRDDLALEQEVFKVEAHFVIDEFKLYEYSTTKLDSLVTAFNECRNCFISLLGFTDDSGSVKYNFTLSEKRVMAVKLYLIDKGIPPTKIYSEYFGEQGDGKRNDRKVEVILFRQ